MQHLCGECNRAIGSLPSVLLTATIACALGVSAAAIGKTPMQFDSNGHCKVVQFSDIQDGPNLDPRTSEAMGRILDAEKPNLVVLTGDQVSTSSCANKQDLELSIKLLAAPMESRHIPWAIVLGNHDNDNIAKIGVTRKEMFAMYRKHANNVNPPDMKDVYGAGDGLLTLKTQDGKDAYGIWLIDSNAYAPETIGGQKLGGYDWIRTSQVVWYYQTSVKNEKRLGHKLPSLMFMHICLPEFVQLQASGKIEGERNEGECPSYINSGMFAAILDRGDVQGVYVGHDHVNMYEGKWYGITLGYGGSIGYGTYGIDSKDEKERNRTRGARIFDINANGTYQSHYLYVDKLGK